MGNFVLTVLVAVGGAPGYPGPPGVAMTPSYHASMTACVVAGRRAERDFSGSRTAVRFSCSYRGDAVTARNPFYPW